jgi:hypothetical protein
LFGFGFARVRKQFVGENPWLLLEEYVKKLELFLAFLSQWS